MESSLIADGHYQGWKDSYIKVSSSGQQFGTATVPYDAQSATAFIVVPADRLDFTWNVGAGNDDASCTFKIYNSAGDLIFKAVAGDMYGFTGQFFTYQNDCSSGTYNVYCDGSLVATNVAGTNYVHSGFNATIGHTWSVKTVCGSGESNSVSVTKDFCSPVSNNEIISNNFTIYPNPASTAVTIIANNNFHTVNVTNYLGQTVISQSNTGNSVKLDISNLTNGVYFISIVSENGTNVNKFVKQ
jgi:hypothetical protein